MKTLFFLLLLSTVAFGQAKEPAATTGAAQTFLGTSTFNAGLLTTTLTASGLISSSVASGSTSIQILAGAKLQFGTASRAYLYDCAAGLGDQVCAAQSLRVGGAIAAGSLYLSTGTSVVQEGTAYATNEAAGKPWLFDDAEGFKSTPKTLATCAAGLEWTIQADVASGVSTGKRSKLCLCTSNGAGSPVYAWQNLATGTVGTTTTCGTE